MNKKIEQLVAFLESDKDIKPSALKELLFELKFESSDFNEWADFQHPKGEGYGRKMVYSGDYFEVMVMSWLPNDFSSIHNHGYTQWGAVQVFGHASHNIFRFDENSKELTLARQESMQPGEIAMVNNALIHQMGNKTQDPYMSLHIYGTPQNMEDVTADSRIFEIEKNRVVETTGGAFFQLAEENVEFLSELYCKDEKTLKEFTATLLPKSIHFDQERKNSVNKWLCQTFKSQNIEQV
jgi:predicted metal-dependent enzyme (double-stranded beta helix superfamily)